MTSTKTDDAAPQTAAGHCVDRGVRPRAAFEAWISAPPYEREVERFDENSAWPGNYRELDVDLAWLAWSAAMALTRERCAVLCEEAGEVAASMYGDGAECLNTAAMCAERIRGA